MPPFVPYIGLTRSQSLRLGRGPGNSLASEMNMGDTPASPQTGALATLFYADLGQALVRRDIQRHSTLGAIESVGSASNIVSSDLYVPSGDLAVTFSGSGYSATVGAGVIASRFYGTRLGVASQTVSIPAPPSVGGQWTYILVNPAGVVSAYSGGTDVTAPSYETWSVTATGASAGTFVIQFQYNGFTFTTAGIAFNALGSAVATAVQAATGGPNNVAFSTYVGGTGNITGGGTALPGGPATVTFSGGAEGSVVPISVDSVGLTGGTAVVTRTNQGIGSQTAWPSGNVQVLAAVYLTSANANANAGQKVTGVVPTS